MWSIFNLPYFPSTYPIDNPFFLRCFQTVEEPTKTINSAFHHRFTVFSCRNDKIKFLVAYFRIPCAAAIDHYTKIKGDAAIAMISVGALAIGYLLMNLFSTSSNLSGDVCSTLFGSTSILTLSKSEVWLCAGLSVVVVAVFLLFYNKIFAVTFDEDFAKAVGTKADLYNLLIAVIVAVVIVLAMNLVGSLLISALVIFPALSAMRLFQNFRSVTVCSAVLSVSCAALGILISILAGTPVGSTIVAVDILAFLICSALGRARGGETG